MYMTLGGYLCDVPARHGHGGLEGNEWAYRLVRHSDLRCCYGVGYGGCQSGTGAWLSGILANLFLSRVAGMGLLVLLLVINIMMMVGHYPMPQGVSLAGLCLPVVGALALDLGLNPIAVCLPVCMSTSMLLLVPIDPTCYTTYSGGYWKIKDMMSTGVVITLGYVVVCSVWTAVVAGIGLLG